MILAHLSELHLGFRAYDRTEGGRNVREADVAAAFERAVEELLRARPDLVVIAGDVFDRVDPRPAALLALTRGLEELRSSLPDTPLVLAGGARDTPLRPGDAAALSVIGSLSGVEAAVGAARSVPFGADLRVCLVPYGAGAPDRSPAPAPDPGARHNVLVAWGEVRFDGRGVPIDPAGWSYVALGGEHGWRTLAPNVAYAGSLERVGATPWGEAARENGFLTVDLETGTLRFHPLPVRPVVSLASVRTLGEGPRGLPARVREVTDEVPGGLDHKIVRLRIRGASPRDLLVLQGELLSDLSRRALHLQVEVEEPPSSAGPPRAEDLLRRRLGEDSADAGRLEELLPPAPAPVAGEAFRPRIAVDDPVLGKVELRLPEGVLAVVSEDPTATRRLLRLAAGPAGAALLPWADPEPSSPDRVLATLEEVLAGALGLAPLEGAPGLAAGDDVTHAGEDAEGAADAPGEGGGSPRELEKRLRELEAAERELGTLEREIRSLRGEHAEVAGDLEQATMEWFQERQDAETHLQAYRDRARELRSRLAQIDEVGPEAPCPMCGRLLGDHFDDVLGELREEWESLVQDGRWWKRRREQLDTKPDRLKELEGRSLRLQSAVEACAERIEGARSRVRERDELRQRLAELRGEERGRDPRERARPLLLEVAREVRCDLRERLLARASRYAQSLTGSRVIALIAEGPGAPVRLEGPGGPVDSDAEEAAAEICLRLAGAALAAEYGPPPAAAILPLELVERLREPERLHLLDLLPSVRKRPRHVLVGMRIGTAERRQEVLDGVLELLPEGPGGAPFRWLAGGRGGLSLAPVREGEPNG